ncbi:MAG: HAD-IA family hydrolase [Verrucomicrobiota bacterium]
MTGIRAVSLDAGGTLVEPWPSVGAIYAGEIRRMGVADPDPSDLDARFHSAWRRRGAFDYSRDAWRRLVGEVLGETVSPRELDPVFERLWTRFVEPDAWHVYPDVRPTLDALARAGVRLCVVSNWDTRLHDVLRGVGLAEAFEFILPSVEGAAPKPDPRLFQQAAQRLALDPADILHVGDSLREDVGGAHEAGMEALWLRRPPAGAEPAHAGSIDSLEVLLPLLTANASK